ncbi:MAG: hypothetical protein R2856_18805 [Caldilineaceae bacterium]
MKRISSADLDYTVTADMVAAENAYGPTNQPNFFKAFFNHFIPLTSSKNTAWNKVTIPADTDLMVVRQVFDFDQFDEDGDYSWDNRFYLGVFNWKDVNGDNNVWEDKDGNKVVNFINDPAITQIDGGQDLVWDDPRTELDQWEFVRFDYSRPGGNQSEVWVQHPLERMEDGLFYWPIPQSWLHLRR